VPVEPGTGNVTRDEGGGDVAVLRTLLGEALRTTRLSQERTLREVSSAARVSLGYLSEVERGQKEASSELLASICRALGVRLSDVLRDVSESLSVLEPEPEAPVTVPDTLPPGLPALEPVGSDGPSASLRTSVHAVRDVVAA
jgi:transcriptional regulator with XRE-family HTH domain